MLIDQISGDQCNFFSVIEGRSGDILSEVYEPKKVATITYHSDSALPEGCLEQLTRQGLEGLLDLIRILVNDATQIERQVYLGAGAPMASNLSRSRHACGRSTSRCRMCER